MSSTSNVLRQARRNDISNRMEDSPCPVCGNQRELQTPWTPVNPGRRFVACPKKKCNDFDWLDPPMCKRSVQIILGLLRMRNKMEEEISRRKNNEKMLRIGLGISWVLFEILWVWKM
ncbi:hypothetical protein RHMOL_Rhmol10G0265000 [Rhododendron molle]|uniref:Uncharacterized protein n=1 Tax=Rhododendron molle TaxID=49168 RepID=A0ACC0M7K6_RHOML|nr:hypothetical protein RHMOL_Rhmol10G0265000 [Rhododendron molle]